MRCAVTPLTNARGFSLLEVVVCAGLLVAVASGVTQLVGMAVHANDAARARTLATILAVQRMEQLRGLAWGTASDVTTNLSTEPADAAGPGLQPSPGGTLDANVPPYVDHLTDEGIWVGNGAAAPPGAAYTRRWSVRALDGDPDHTRVLDVLVRPARATRAAEVHLVSTRTRRQ